MAALCDRDIFICRYEEKYFTRLPVTKQERHKKRKMLTLGTLGDELTRFDGGEGSSGSKKRKLKVKGKKSMCKMCKNY